MKPRSPTPPTAALASPEVAKLLHQLQDQIIKEVSVRMAAPGEVVLQPFGKGSVRYFAVANGEGMAISGDHGACTTLYRELQPNRAFPKHFKPAAWYGSEDRLDAAGRLWSRSLGRFVCDDFGALVEVAV